MKKAIIIILSAIITAIVTFILIIIVPIFVNRYSKIPTAFDGKELYCSDYNITIYKKNDKIFNGYIIIDGISYELYLSYNDSNGSLLSIENYYYEGAGLHEEISDYVFNDNSLEIYVKNTHFTKDIYNKEEGDIILFYFEIR